MVVRKVWWIEKQWKCGDEEGIGKGGVGVRERGKEDEERG